MLHSDRNCARESGACRLMNRESGKKDPERMRAGLLFFLLFSWDSVFLCCGCLTVLSLYPSQGAVLHGERRDFSAGCCATGECVLSTEMVALLWAGSSRVLFLNLSK